MADEEKDTKTSLLNESISNDYGTIVDIDDETELLPPNKSKRKGEKSRKKKSGFSLLFKFATRVDIALMSFGALFGILSGALSPILGLFFGSMTNAFISQATYGLIPDESISNSDISNSSAVPVNLTSDSFIKDASKQNGKILYKVQYVLGEWFEADNPSAWSTIVLGTNSTVPPLTVTQFRSLLNVYMLIYITIGTLMMIFSFLQTYCWERASEHMVYNVRKTYLGQILRQDISWYDLHESTNLSNKLADDAERIREGTGYKCALIIQFASTFVNGILVGLAVNLYLTVVILCVAPVLIILSACAFKFGVTSMAREQQKYAAAGAVAEEVLTNIKTVNAFGGQEVEVAKYNHWLEEGRKDAKKKYNLFAVLIGLMFFFMYGVYALGFYVGSYLIQAGISNAGSVFTVFFSVVIGSLAIGQTLPYWNVVSGAIGILSSIDDIIERKVTIDPYSQTGRKPSNFVGRIEFRNTSFTYPSRPEIKILDNFNLVIEPGKQVAIVGSSGAGKSTIVSLLLRFYDPTEGEVYIDNIAVRDYNTKWLRRQIGFVSQEPVLFGVSIAENITYGRDDVTHEEVIEAAKQANAHDFIINLPKGYETLVGDTGSQLSGGQKQRIAIARALVRDPKILLLDEATSALDALSEGVVQDALEKVMKGRTTVIVAHRLSTIRKADTICVMQGGKLAESGTHLDLMNKKSFYYDLVQAQMMMASKSPSEVDSGGNGSLASDSPDDETFFTSSMGASMVSGTSGDGANEAPEVIEPEEDEEDREGEDASLIEGGPKKISSWKTITSAEEENPSYKVLESQMSSETISDDDDDEYETVVVRIRETREILYSDEEDEDDRMDDNEETITPKRISTSSRKTRKLTDEDAPRTRKRRLSSQEIKRESSPPEPEVTERDITVCELIKLQLPEWPWLTLGMIGFVGCGMVTPLFAICYGAIFRVFTLTGFALKEATIHWTYLLIGFAVFCGLTWSIQVAAITYANEKVIARVRASIFQNILRQPVGWFDMDVSSPGVLINRLARNAPLIKAAAGLRAGQVLSAFVTIIAASVIAVVSGWKLAVCLLILIPIIIILSMKQQNILSRNVSRDVKLMDNAGRIASETVRNIRTVQSLGQEQLFTDMYTKNLEEPYKEGKTQALIYSTLFGFTQGLTFYMHALAFRAGGYLIENHEMTSEDMYRVFFALSLCAATVGTSFSYMADYTKARHSVRLLNFLLKRKSEIDSSSKLGARPDIVGKIEFENVHFSYPNRPSVKVLRGLSLSVEAGKTLALVGESGCGKSTVISLLERFYDPQSGSILVDGYDIRTLNLAYLRSKIGIVTQEPILFDRSIRDNIAYGAITLQEGVPFDQIKAAAQMANIDEFIMGLPDRYDTLVGQRGVQLSGGQKQRVAIARALIRNPKILLLDEATSALDTESEKVVQAALDVAKVGRTCIVVAHRLSTIQNADVICVVQKGRIVEYGTHAELEERKGQYYELTQRQNLN